MHVDCYSHNETRDAGRGGRGAHGTREIVPEFWPGGFRGRLRTAPALVLTAPAANRRYRRYNYNNIMQTPSENVYINTRPSTECITM